MIGAFPDLYPDEFLVSAWARYEAWVQYPYRKALLEDLFGYDIQSVDYVLPSCLGAFAAALPPSHSAASVTKLITKHTLFPYYGAFLPSQQQQLLRQQMAEHYAVNIRAPLGLSQSSHQMPRTLRFCPICAAHDRLCFGETYWHRLHQAAGVEVCPQHLVCLETTEAPMWLTPGQLTFPLAETTVPVLPARTLNSENLMGQQLLRLAQTAQYLLEHPELSLEDFQLQTRSRVQLVAMGMASYGKRFKQTAILEAFQNKFTLEFLAHLSCHWSTRYETTCWLSRLLQGGQNTPNFVLYSLLLILFVAENLPAFLELPTNFAPFGAGPWFCLNPACPQDGEQCITVCDLYYHPDGTPRGTFSCPTCEFSYRRTGPDSTIPARTYHVLKHGPLWDSKLRELWFDPRMNLARMSSALRSTWDYMRRRGTELGLPFPPLGVRPTLLTSNPLPLKESPQILDPTTFRSRWLAILEQHPNWGVNDIRKDDNKLYAWLQDNDRDWLNQHKPSRRYKRQDTRVNWQQRDTNLAAEVSAGYQALMERQSQPFRVTGNAILNEIRRGNYFHQNRYRLPQTTTRLEQLVDTTESFAIRRIWHYARQFREAGEVPRRRVLAEKASIKGSLHQENLRIQAVVDEAMTWLQEG